MSFINLSDNMSMKMTIFHSCDAMSSLVPCCDIIVTLTPLPVLQNLVDMPRKVLCEFETIQTDGSGDMGLFVHPLFFWSDHF